MLEQKDILDYDTDGNTTELTRSYYHANALGSVMEITDANEATVVSYRYDPYGAVTITRGGSPQSTDPLGQHWVFTGRFADEESGLHYFRARYYDSVTGRFLQRDPLGYGAGPNLFEYAESNPIMKVDPLGLFSPRYLQGDGVSTVPDMENAIRRGINRGKNPGYWLCVWQAYQRAKKTWDDSGVSKKIDETLDEYAEEAADVQVAGDATAAGSHVSSEIASGVAGAFAGVALGTGVALVGEVLSLAEHNEAINAGKRHQAAGRAADELRSRLSNILLADMEKCKKANENPMPRGLPATPRTPPGPTRTVTITGRPAPWSDGENNPWLLRPGNR